MSKKPKTPTKKQLYHAEFCALRNAIHRCTKRTNAQYADYGGRGITVDSSFLGPDGFDNFLKAVGPKPSPELTLDRVSNDKGYEPGNLAWTSRTVQQRNCRARRAKVTDLGHGLRGHGITRKDGKTYTVYSPLVPCNGEVLSLREWSERLGVHQRTLKQRLMRGSTPEQAFQPVLFTPWGNVRGEGPSSLRAKSPKPTIH